MEYKIDFSEPIPKMIQRLKNEHHVFRLEFIQIEETSKANSEKASIEFLDKRIPQLEKSQEAGGEIKRFVDNLTKHFLEEEENVYLLALRVDSI